ncbi:MAG: hypothetical protein ACUVV5_05735, partial [Candidatus Aminicenantales bacterium]
MGTKMSRQPAQPKSKFLLFEWLFSEWAARQTGAAGSWQAVRTGAAGPERRQGARRTIMERKEVNGDGRANHKVELPS